MLFTFFFFFSVLWKVPFGQFSPVLYLFSSEETRPTIFVLQLQEIAPCIKFLINTVQIFWREWKHIFIYRSSGLKKVWCSQILNNFELINYCNFRSLVFFHAQFYTKKNLYNTNKISVYSLNRISKSLHSHYVIFASIVLSSNYLNIYFFFKLVFIILYYDEISLLSHNIVQKYPPNSLIVSM